MATCSSAREGDVPTGHSVEVQGASKFGMTMATAVEGEFGVMK
eukprot:CAMPEP_0119408030 /NCGR_PEP_ID=MMETSP1335-20130426/1719_1 /TAXON_ID=259385 /ORGANISM="Chrysoculter rhomboideus, Strain RCC1486" /LENGTH=42 /DNA_ID= /DNA_START= /DNA_END= /DNA_ORIENTATION=